MRPLSKFCLTAFTILALLAVPNHTWSCGPDLSAEAARFVLFQPGLAGMENLDPFYYNERFVGSFSSDINNKDYKRNCREWHAYTGNSVKEDDIFKLEYETDPAIFEVAWATRNWQKLKGNTFVQWLQKDKNEGALKYFAFAKGIEGAQTGGDINPWHLSPNLDSLYGSLALFAVKVCQTSQPGFLRDRYAFQAVKLMYYQKTSTAQSNEPVNERVTTFYDKYLMGKSTIVADWALVYYGLSLPPSNKKTLALLHAFYRSEEKKGYIHQFINKDWLEALADTMHDPETNMEINVLKALKNPGRGLHEIEQVYRQDPTNKYLPLLICREVNKLEDWILSPEILGFNARTKENQFEREHPDRYRNGYDTSYAYFAQANLHSDKEYLKHVNTVLITMLDAGFYNPDLLRLSIAHLYHMQHQFTAADKYLDQIKDTRDTIYKKQVLIEKAVSLIYSKNIASPAVKQKLYNNFQGLQQAGIRPPGKEEDDYEGMDKTNDALPELYLMLSQQYKNLGDIVTAGLLFQKADMLVNDYYGYGNGEVSYKKIAYFDKYASPADVDSLIRFKHMKNKSAFQKMISPATWAPDDLYRDLKGTILLREQKYDEALTTMNEIQDDFWMNAYEYKNYLPHTAIASVGTLLPVKNGPAAKYRLTSKKLILKDITTLQHSLQADTSKASRAGTCFLLANAYYNLTYYGKAWMMYSYGKTSRELGGSSPDDYQWAWYTFYPNRIRYRKSYYQCADAINMYQQAYTYARQANRKELAAQCLIMLAECDKQAHIARLSMKDTKGINHYSNDDGTDYVSGYLKTLRTKYSNTGTYAAGSAQCPDITAYLNAGK